MKYLSELRPATSILTISQILVLAMLSGCGLDGAIKPSANLETRKHQLSADERIIVDAAVRQIIKDTGTAKITTMAAAPGRQADRTDVCGYVKYVVMAPDTAIVSSAPTEVRYFIQLGMENSKRAALMGQVASDPAKSAKVKFMCQRAGLD